MKKICITGSLHWDIVITTNNIPENVMCDYNIEISAEDLNGNDSVKSIYFHVMTMNENM